MMSLMRVIIRGRIFTPVSATSAQDCTAHWDCVGQGIAHQSQNQKSIFMDMEHAADENGGGKR